MSETEQRRADDHVPDRIVDRHAYQRARREIERAQALLHAQDALRHHVIGGDPVGKNDGRLFRPRQRVVKNQIDKGNDGHALLMPRCLRLQRQNL